MIRVHKQKLETGLILYYITEDYDKLLKILNRLNIQLKTNCYGEIFNNPAVLLWTDELSEISDTYKKHRAMIRKTAKNFKAI